MEDDTLARPAAEADLGSQIDKRGTQNRNMANLSGSTDRIGV